MIHLVKLTAKSDSAYVRVAAARWGSTGVEPGLHAFGRGIGEHVLGVVALIALLGRRRGK